MEREIDERFVRPVIVLSEQHRVRFEFEFRVSCSKMLDEKRLKSDWKKNTDPSLQQHKKQHLKHKCDVIYHSSVGENDSLKCSKRKRRFRFISVSVSVLFFCSFGIGSFGSVSASSDDLIQHHLHNGRVCSHRHPKDHEVGKHFHFEFRFIWELKITTIQ